MQSTQKPSIYYSVACLLIVGVLFYSSYGFANWLAAQKEHLPEIYWVWETHIPFLEWTIIPYWSLNLCYAAASFFCQNKAQLHHLIKQLLLAQFIAVICFLIYPLTFTWEKPITSGILGSLFQLLAGFDQPYNQAPSLHIILTIIIGRFYWYRLQSIFSKILWAIWFTLIGISVLTTYQHHFIDIPTGLFVAFLILYYLPWYKNEPVKQSFFRQTPTGSRLQAPRSTRVHVKWGTFYIIIASIFTAIAYKFNNTGLWFIWPAVAYLYFSLIYLFADPALMQKQPNGHHTLMVAWLFLPCKLFILLNIKFWLRKKPITHQIIDNIHVGSILSVPDYRVVIDVCAEYPVNQTPEHYACIPMLDMVPLNDKALSLASEKLRTFHAEFPDQDILICCALGYSRSVAVIVTYLIKYHNMSHSQAYAFVKEKHSKCVLSEALSRAVYKAGYGK